MIADEIGRIYLADDIVDPLRLLAIDGACIVEVKDGQYRVERLPEPE